MILGKFNKTPGERRRYTIDYTAMLSTEETLTNVTYSVRQATEHPLVVDQQIIQPEGKKITFYVSGGDDQITYDLDITADTSLGQIKEDLVTFSVRKL